jgi:hypothetical protein
MIFLDKTMIFLDKTMIFLDKTIRAYSRIHSIFRVQVGASYYYKKRFKLLFAEVLIMNTLGKIMIL